jgi:spermidine synthase
MGRSHPEQRGTAASAGNLGSPAPAKVAPPEVDRERAGSGWALVPIVAVSGFAGLGYEIVWTRELSLALGTEMMAVLGAVAGFFGGLALGAFGLDRPIRQAGSPRAAYAVLEAMIGVWGFVSIWLLPGAARALPPLLGTEPAAALLWGASRAVALPP